MSSDASACCVLGTSAVCLAVSLAVLLLCQKKKNAKQDKSKSALAPKSNYKPAPSQAAKPAAATTPSQKNPNQPAAAAGGPLSSKTTNNNDPLTSKADANNPEMFTTPLDKTQEDSKSIKVKSTKSTASKNDKKDDKEKASAGGGPSKNEKDTKDDKKDDNLEPPVTVPEEKVQVLGNLDDVIKEKKTQLQKEIEDMGSQHEHDKKQIEPLKDRHVVINEAKCKMYTTNNEETKEDDANDDLI